MKQTAEKPATTKQIARSANDALCKRLAKEYPEQFAHWLFGTKGKVEVEKTELSREPIRADAVIFSSEANETLHGEFQTTMKSDVAVPLRFLDYYVGFKRRHPMRRVRQVLVVLKPTEERIPDRYEDERTWHEYDVVKMWEQDPAVLLHHEGLLPLATLCRAASAEQLLQDVAVQVLQIKTRERRGEALNWARMLAGLRYNRKLIGSILKETDMLEESVIYQDILRKGRKQGLQQGLQQGLEQGLERERKLVMRLLERALGKLSARTRKQIEALNADQLEKLGEEFVEFKNEKALTAWLKQHAA
jgi:predicted transposase YdaD